MQFHNSAMALAATALLVVTTPAWGQRIERDSSSSGLFGERTLGRGANARDRTFGGSGGGLVGVGEVGTVDSSDRFRRENRQPGAFVGTSAADVQNFLGAVQAGENARRGSGMAGLRAGQGARRGDPNRNQGARGSGRRGRRAADLRISLHAAFDYPKTPAAQMSLAMTRRLGKSLAVLSGSDLDVEIRDGTATLRGVVATDHDRRVAERMVRLEPGVWRVKNDLTVPETLPGPPLLQQPAEIEEQQQDKGKRIELKLPPASVPEASVPEAEPAPLPADDRATDDEPETEAPEPPKLSD